jgi:hypothetical protein
MRRVTPAIGEAAHSAGPGGGSTTRLSNSALTRETFTPYSACGNSARFYGTRIIRPAIPAGNPPVATAAHQVDPPTAAQPFTSEPEYLPQLTEVPVKPPIPDIHPDTGCQYAQQYTDRKAHLRTEPPPCRAREQRRQPANQAAHDGNAFAAVSFRSFHFHHFNSSGSGLVVRAAYTAQRNV